MVGVQKATTQLASTKLHKRWQQQSEPYTTQLIFSNEIPVGMENSFKTCETVLKDLKLQTYPTATNL